MRLFSRFCLSLNSPLVLCLVACSGSLDGRGKGGNSGAMGGPVTTGEAEMNWGTMASIIKYNEGRDIVPYIAANPATLRSACFDNSSKFQNYSCQGVDLSSGSAYSSYPELRDDPAIIQGFTLYFNRQLQPTYSAAGAVTGTANYDPTQIKASMTVQALEFDIYTGEVALGAPYTKNVAAAGCSLSSPTAVGFNAISKKQLFVGMALMTEGKYRYAKNSSSESLSYVDASALALRIQYRSLRAFQEAAENSPTGAELLLGLLPDARSENGSYRAAYTAMVGTDGRAESVLNGLVATAQSQALSAKPLARVSFQLTESDDAELIRTSGKNQSYRGKHVITAICMDAGYHLLQTPITGGTARPCTAASCLKDPALLYFEGRFRAPVMSLVR